MHMLADFPFSLLIGLAIIAFGIWTWIDAQKKALALASDGKGRLHSLPGYHGWYGALWVVVPALAFLLLYQVIGQGSVRSLLGGGLSSDVLALPADQLDLFVSNAYKIAFGGTPSTVTPELERAAQSIRSIC
jgi:phosphate transport system permease protein